MALTVLSALYLQHAWRQRSYLILDGLQTGCSKDQHKYAYMMLHNCKTGGCYHPLALLLSHHAACDRWLMRLGGIWGAARYSVMRCHALIYSVSPGTKWTFVMRLTPCAWVETVAYWHRRHHDKDIDLLHVACPKPEDLSASFRICFFSLELLEAMGEPAVLLIGA
jgi:hypothetical protein